MLELDDLSLVIGTQPLVNSLNLKLEPGLLHAIIGPNGTGKTSLLRALFGELPPKHGDIRVNGKSMANQRASAWKRQFGYMPQYAQLDLDLSVLEVVILGRQERLGMRLSDQDIAAALEALKTLGIAHLADCALYTLSGGQRQMALFAQVLLREPAIMMLDEPVSALDLQHQLHLMEHLHHQTRTRNWISLVVLHDLNLAAQYADRLIVLADCALQAFGTPRDVLDADLVGRIYQVPVDVHRDHDDKPFIRTKRPDRDAT